MCIEIVNTEHSNTASNLSKPIKEPKIITRQPEKTKIYTEPTAADRMLQLDIIKKHYLPLKMFTC